MWFAANQLIFMQVQVNSRKAQALHNNVDRTTQSMKELDTKIKNVIQNVHSKELLSPIKYFFITWPVLCPETISPLEFNIMRKIM